MIVEDVIVSSHCVGIMFYVVRWTPKFDKKWMENDRKEEQKWVNCLREYKKTKENASDREHS